MNIDLPERGFSTIAIGKRGGRQNPPWTAAENETLQRLWPSAAWKELFVALPGRSYQAICIHAKRVLHLQRAVEASQRRPWSAADKAHLRRLWRYGTREEVEWALPGRAWHSIVRMASNLELRRSPTIKRSGKYIPHPVFAALRKARENADMTRIELADKMGHHHNQIAKWENGKQLPRWRALLDWLDALNLDLSVLPRIGRTLR